MSVTGAGAVRTASGGRRAAILGVAALAVVAAALGAWRFHARGTTANAAGSAGAQSIAVLPFEYVGDTANAYFADGITDAVRGKLSGLPGLTVIARASSVSYRGTSKQPGVIANELGVRYLLTGTVRFAAGATHAACR